ncbi:hypothetical protein BC827DRAFT_1271600 [Russula dissimulans]|nr:hypothetical protein BC827DRAFT_1271600 [Russula dissimulans]
MAARSNSAADIIFLYPTSPFLLPQPSAAVSSDNILMPSASRLLQDRRDGLRKLGDALRRDSRDREVTGFFLVAARTGGLLV